MQPEDAPCAFEAVVVFAFDEMATWSNSPFWSLALPSSWECRGASCGRRSHGFYRFLAWASILLLILLNLDYWFTDALPSLYIFVWLLLFLALFLVMRRFHLLRVIRKPILFREIQVARRRETIHEPDYA